MSAPEPRLIFIVSVSTAVSTVDSICYDMILRICHHDREAPPAALEV